MKKYILLAFKYLKNPKVLAAIFALIGTNGMQAYLNTKPTIAKPTVVQIKNDTVRKQEPILVKIKVIGCGKEIKEHEKIYHGGK